MNASRSTFPAVAAMTGLAIAAAFGLSACGDDADAAVRDGVVTVTLSDYAFDGLPREVAAGTRIAVRNASTHELHEFVAVRLADDDERPIDEVVLDGEQLFEAGPPAAVLLAPPGGDQIDALGDGTLAEPGRYVIICNIPAGVDPHEFLSAAGEGDGPPDVDAAGAPHSEYGMFAELLVTDE